MTELVEIIKGQGSWSLEDISLQMNTTVEDVKRQLEYLEHIGMISRIETCKSECWKCSKKCDMGIGRANMPVFYELVKNDDIKLEE